MDYNNNIAELTNISHISAVRGRKGVTQLFTVDFFKKLLVLCLFILTSFYCSAAHARKSLAIVLDDSGSMSGIFETSRFLVQSILSLYNHGDNVIVSKLSVYSSTPLNDQCDKTEITYISSAARKDILKSIRDLNNYTTAGGSQYRSILNGLACAYEATDEVVMLIITDGDFYKADEGKFETVVKKLKDKYQDIPVSISLIRIVKSPEYKHQGNIKQILSSPGTKQLSSVYGDSFQVELVHRGELKDKMAELVALLSAMEADKAVTYNGQKLIFKPKFNTTRMTLLIDSSKENLQFTQSTKDVLAQLNANIEEFNPRMLRQDTEFRDTHIQKHRIYHIYFAQTVPRDKAIEFEFDGQIDASKVRVLIDKKPYAYIQLTPYEEESYLHQTKQLTVGYVNPQVNASPPLPSYVLTMNGKQIDAGELASQDGINWLKVDNTHELTEMDEVIYSLVVTDNHTNRIYKDELKIKVLPSEIKIDIEPKWHDCKSCNQNFNEVKVSPVDANDLNHKRLLPMFVNIDKSGEVELSFKGQLPPGISIVAENGDLLDANNTSIKTFLTAGNPLKTYLQYNGLYQPTYSSEHTLQLQAKSISHTGQADFVFELKSVHQMTLEYQQMELEITDEQPASFDLYALLDGQRTSELPNATLEVKGLPHWLSVKRDKNSATDSWVIEGEVPFLTPLFLVETGPVQLTLILDSQDGNQQVETATLQISSLLSTSALLLQFLWKLLWIVLLIIYVIGIIKKSRFGKNACITFYDMAIRGERDVLLKNGFVSRWLLPFKAEVNYIEGLKLVAGQNKSYVLLHNIDENSDLLVDNGEPYPDSKHRVRVGSGTELSVPNGRKGYSVYTYNAR